MRQTFNYAFYCRASKADRKGMSPIEVSIIVNGKRTFLQLPYRCKSEDFNRKRRPKEIQEYLDTMQGVIGGIVTDMARNAVPLTAANLKEYLKNGGFKTYTVNDLFKAHLALLKQRVGIDLTEAAYVKYERSRNLFEAFYGGDKEVGTITPVVAETYYLYLQKKYKTATASSYMAKFHTVIRFALDNGYLKVNPFQNIRVRHPKPEVAYLTDDEVRRIITTPIDNESLSNVRDAFVLQLSTGMAYADIASLKKEDIKVTEDGIYYIHKPRVKTGVEYTTVILPEGVEVLRRHNWEMRVISNQKSNAYLKLIQDLCGIKTNLTTHLARHTFAQRLLSSGVRIETVSASLGHSTIRTTQKYYCKIRQSDVIREVMTAMR